MVVAVVTDRPADNRRASAATIAADLAEIKQIMETITELAHKVLARTEVLTENIDDRERNDGG